ncbi:TetR/AcrR family transcriptional regulator [Limosilactobacillus fastidiosus]|uniref:TetR/AcrR family transcriptional regulator n=1 Tax=Limosilactobacillus fastidiosus TaxID=2759855 RepID=A0A7W3TY91_9LACO|nr:TetR/AcrR family transcriptional regulator [Limosilactobacillus fastidiosus]MBB1062539.1 TetR/AcrR family transcriptional regulator [Limosilactobacillus fastidiosus]MBB1085509.1 TetR/AcrR family transcriptional regulator [Limosilactobacillus fastidiosus]MCD7083613.1 TetR/AcrR family transcriptional regulator [Limosilactobacillus fastidiosus]MCD7085962.1 TetR/AcrR family transcriptional regulator [Limosilactobacillus fastidiosus]MCD7114394.1 TetR/AcrR family transcriptional regulator [Limosi
MNTNLKYLRTENSIRDAVVTLINDEGLNKITVRQISTLAHINRTTFYRHYLDKPDLISKYRDNFLEQVSKIVREELPNVTNYYNLDSIGTPYSLFKRIIDFIVDNWAFCQSWLGPKGDLETRNQFMDLISEKLKEKFNQVQKYHNLHPKIPLEFAQELIVSQLWSILKIWFQQPKPLSKEKIIDIVLKTRYLSPFELTGLSELTIKSK